MPESRGSLRDEGVSELRRISSATTALRDDESGDVRGPGVNPAIDRLDRVNGRFRAERLAPRREVEEADGCASDGNKGVDIVLSSGEDRIPELPSSEDRLEFSNTDGAVNTELPYHRLNAGRA